MCPAMTHQFAARGTVDSLSNIRNAYGLPLTAYRCSTDEISRCHCSSESKKGSQITNSICFQAFHKVDIENLHVTVYYVACSR